MSNKKISAALILSAVIMISNGAVAQDDDVSPRVGNISAAQQDNISRRMNTLRLWSFAFGPAGASGMNNSNLMYSFTLAHHWEVNENAELRANIHTTLPSKGIASFTSFGLGGSWFMTNHDISPLVGGEIGYGYAFIPKLPNQSGFSAGAHIGVRFFRTAATQMAAEAYGKTILAADASARPVDFGATLSILY